MRKTLGKNGENQGRTELELVELQGNLGRSGGLTDETEEVLDYTKSKRSNMMGLNGLTEKGRFQAVQLL